MFQKYNLFASWTLMLFLILFTYSCHDPLLVGNDLLDDQRINILQIDTFDLSSQTVAGQRVVTHRPTIDSRNYYLGVLNDPTFGSTKAEIILKFQMNALKPSYANESVQSFDSLVLSLQYDSLALFGASSGNQRLEVFQLENTYAENDTFYSDFNPAASFRSIADVTKSIRPRDSVQITDHITRSAIKTIPQLRIRLNDGFGNALLSNLEASQNDTIFNTYMKGFKIVSTPTDNASFLYGFDFTNAALNTQNSTNRLIMYYTIASGDTTIRKTYEYLINFATINRITFDQKGSQLENTINTPSLGNQLTYLIPMGGPKTVVKFNDIKKLGNRLINKAELEIYVAEPNGKEIYNSAPYQLLASYKLSSGNQALIPDIDQLVNSSSDFTPVFGGTLNNSNQVHKYVLNITNHIKSALKDPNHNSDLNLNILTESEVANRALLYGAKHSTYPMKLKITYTKN